MRLALRDDTPGRPGLWFVETVANARMTLATKTKSVFAAGHDLNLTSTTLNNQAEMRPDRCRIK